MGVQSLAVYWEVWISIIKQYHTVRLKQYGILWYTSRLFIRKDDSGIINNLECYI